MSVTYEVKEPAKKWLKPKYLVTVTREDVPVVWTFQKEDDAKKHYEEELEKDKEYQEPVSSKMETTEVPQPRQEPVKEPVDEDPFGDLG